MKNKLSKGDDCLCQILEGHPRVVIERTRYRKSVIMVSFEEWRRGKNESSCSFIGIEILLQAYVAFLLTLDRLTTSKNKVSLWWLKAYGMFVVRV